MDPFTRRQLLMDKLERAKLRVDRSIQLREEKTLLDCKNEVITIRHNFEEAHIMYVAKTRRTEITDAGQRDLFNKFNDSAQEALDSILAFLSKNKEEREAETLYDLYEEIMSEVTHEEQTVQSTLESRPLLGPERESYLQEMNAIQLRLNQAKFTEGQLLDQCSSADRRKELKAQMMKVKTALLTGLRRLKLLLTSTLVARVSVGGGEMIGDHQSSEPAHNSSSSNYNGGSLGSVDPLEENLGGALPAAVMSTPAGEVPTYSSAERTSTPGLGINRFKAKKLDFPKFNGNIRNYNSFKRDFKTIVEGPGEYTREQMSVILRTECLTGGSKHIVENLFEYSEIWDQLDRDYDDEGRVIQQILQQITDFKEISDENKEAFIQFVDLIFKAHTDINAFASSAVLAHPVVVSTILKKCPSWASTDLCSEMAKQKIKNTEQFEFIRRQLVVLREQAREMAKLRRCTNKAGPVKGARVNTAMVNSGANSGQYSSTSQGFVCCTPGCKYKKPHKLFQCIAFKNLDLNVKGEVVRDAKLCTLCLGDGHDVNTCGMKASWTPCGVNGCTSWHSRYLHGATVPGLIMTLQGDTKTVLLIQAIPLKDGGEATAFWDPGSTTALVTFKFAAENNLKGTKCTFEMSGVEGVKKRFETQLYTVPLIDRTGKMHSINAYGITKITETGVNQNMLNAVKEFKLREEEVLINPREVDLLIGMSHVSIMPRIAETRGGLALYKSMFGTGKLLGGSTQEEGENQMMEEQAELKSDNLSSSQENEVNIYLDELKNDLKKVEKTNTELSKEIVVLKRETGTLRDDLDATRIQLDEANKPKDVDESMFDDNDDKMMKLRNEVTALTDDKLRLMKEKEKQKEVLHKLKEELRRTKTRVEKSKASILETRDLELEEKKVVKEQESEELRKQVATVEHQLQQAKNENESLETTLEEQRQLLTTNIQNFNGFAEAMIKMAKKESELSSSYKRARIKVSNPDSDGLVWKEADTNLG